MTIAGTFLSTNSAGAIPEDGFTVVKDLMVAAAAGTNSDIIYGFDNFRRTEFLNPTVPGERIMVRFKTFDGTERAGSAGSVSVIPGRQV